ncbi:beta-lactamase family protein [Rhodocytophaga rosea]|uniref:Beta-lactamase family protein n=1 Tax=Rhodocytophaga rosea TaxID=2704465 RepID=A0A6C0GS91_9BACT|nr:serine hydrolase domain-containing protein [Rhodocytophaga rosea]QHT70807.1 beta-lactamase family protein [Rhodocytophaga rosea]
MKRSTCLLVGFLLTVHLSAQDNIETTLDSIFSKHTLAGSPGCSVGIVKNGKLLHIYRRGLANLSYDIAIREGTVFRVASIAKQFTAACIGLLIVDKKLSLQDDVRKYIPELPFYGNVITIQHLLNQTSGIRNYNVLQDIKGYNPELEGVSNKEVYELLFRQKGINHVPGEKMLYSNSNYVLLALVVERVSGNSLHEFAAERIFHPMGMNNTFFKTSNREIIKNGAYNYYKDAKGYKQAMALNIITGAGGLYSTVEDLAKWTTIFSSTDSLSKTLASFLTTKDTLSDGSFSGYGRGVFVDAYKGYPTIHHSGMDLGLKAQMISVPSENLSLIILSNLESINAIDLSYQILDLLLKGVLSTQTKGKIYIHKKTALQHFTGDYQEINSDLTIRILVENDTLKAKNRLSRLAVPLVASGKNEFERINNASVTHKFNTQEERKWDMAVDFAGATFYFEKVQLVEAASVKANEYVGEYYSAEMGVTYSLSAQDNELLVSFPYNPKIKLTAGQQDEFGSGNRTRYIFQRNKHGEVISFTIASEGTVKDILFEKVSSIKRSVNKKIE